MILYENIEYEHHEGTALSSLHLRAMVLYETLPWQSYAIPFVSVRFTIEASSLVVQEKHNVLQLYLRIAFQAAHIALQLRLSHSQKTVIQSLFLSFIHTFIQSCVSECV